MTIETQLHCLLEHLLSTDTHANVSVEQLIQAIDLTLLKEHALDDEFNHLNHLAQSNPIAAVCVYPDDLWKIEPSRNFNLATVVNFPKGNNELKLCINEINKAITFGVKEIDYVFPYQIYIKGNKNLSLDHCNAVSHYCKQQGLSLKIILETGALPDIKTIYDLSRDVLSIGCDFLKTSTGKIDKGASLPALLSILTAIKDSNKKCGVKVSGGIKVPQQAHQYAYLAELIMARKIENDWFRIGASSLLEELVKDECLRCNK